MRKINETFSKFILILMKKCLFLAFSFLKKEQTITTATNGKNKCEKVKMRSKEKQIYFI